MPTQLDTIEEKIDRVLELLTATPVDPPWLSAPTGFTAVYDPGTRQVTCSWDASDYEVEVHEFATDPDATLKAVLAPGATSRTSSTLKGGHDYIWALRTRDGSSVSAFTELITTDVPLKGEDEPDQDDEPELPDEDDETPPTSGGPHPHNVLDLRNWTIMLPVGKQGDPDNDYAADWGTIPNVFFVRDGAVVFRAPANGVHSPNSKYVRCEAREMADTDWTKAAWTSEGPRTIEIELSIDARNLESRKRINGVQIHDGGDDVCQIMRHEDWGLGFMHKDGDEFIPIDANYVDGTRFKCKIEVKNNRIKVWYNGVLAVNVEKQGTGWYWKFGCYNQTGGASDYNEPDSAFGEVVVYSYTIT